MRKQVFIAKHKILEVVPIGLALLLKNAGLCVSTSDAMRMVKQNAVSINGEKVSDPKQIFKSGTQAVFQVGKRKFAQITVK